MDSAGQLDVLVGDGVRIAPHVYREAADGGEENFDVRTCDQLRVHAVGHPEYALPQDRLGAAEPPRYLREVPNRFDRGLAYDALAGGEEDLPVRDEPPGRDGLASLRQVDVGLRDGDGRADVEPLVEVSAVDLGGELFIFIIIVRRCSLSLFGGESKALKTRMNYFD